MYQSILENYGKPVEHWISVLKKSGLSKHGEMIKILKSHFGFSHGFANLVVHKARQSDAGSVENTEDLVSVQYSSGKENLYPIYQKLIREIKKFGKDVGNVPKKSYENLRRKKQFGLIQPSTKLRIDVGINIKGKDPSEKLELSGNFNAMVSHRVRGQNISGVTKDVVDWLNEAYDEAGYFYLINH